MSMFVGLHYEGLCRDAIWSSIEESCVLILQWRDGYTLMNEKVLSAPQGDGARGGSMSSKGAVGFVLGSVFGAAIGAVAGILLAPRSGAESRAMASDAMNDAWDAAADACEKGTAVLNERINAMRPTVDATTDELRAKIDLARERMDQLRSSLSDNVVAASATVNSALNAVADKGTPAGSSAPSAEAVDVHVADAYENENHAE